MSVGDLPFLAALVALAGLIHLLPWLRLRQGVLAAGSAVFLYSNFAVIDDAIIAMTSFAMMVVFVASGFLAAKIVARLPPAMRRWGIGGYVGALMLWFCIMKHYQFLGVALPLDRLGYWPIIGLSYMIFRQIHFLVDSAEGEITDATAWDYLNWQFNFLTLCAGPIQRFQDFRESWRVLTPVYQGTRDIGTAYCRLLLGALKVGALGEWVLAATLKAGDHQRYLVHAHDWLAFAVIFYGFPLYVFLNFSGYCDIVIAGAGLLGMRLPENFNQPYVSRNMIDFWTRWHMSLGLWIRDYLFTPLLKTGLERWPSHAGLINNVTYFISLFLVGVWHGSTVNFAIFGLLNGAGVATAKAWETHLIARLGRKGFRAYLERKGLRVAMVALTLHFVCFALLFFPPDLNGRLTFLRHLFDLHPPAAQEQ
jgi:D-alanyl-lipoteichoic acid acyltransferase DltB (MBOAT superfamily)